MPEEKRLTLRKASPSFGRLKEALEKLQGHEKYRTKTRSPSDGDDVRWYFSNAPLSLQEVAASVPASEIVGKSDFLRFSVNDSLTLEAAFLEREEELVSAWWKEYAECSEGPKLGDTSKEGISPGKGSGRGDGTDESRGGEDPSGSRMSGKDAKSALQDGSDLYDDDKMIGVSVKGGLHEVDLLRRRSYSVYWTDDHRRVLRGHWFAQKGGLDWLPLREDVSEQLEFAYRSQIWHRRTFQPSGRFAARLNLQGTTEGLHALFTGEDDTWEAWLNVDTSVISFLCGMWGNGVKLRRGFAPSQSSQPTQDELNQREEEKKDDYCAQVPVRHLVFMVHGIGQRLGNANLVDDVSNFRHLSMMLADNHLTAYQRNTQRVLFIPCQWRKGLKLSGEEAVESCTLEGVRALRTMLSATVHDVLYYMSPVYCQDIINSVTGQLVRLYCKFIKRNPGYDGKVSLYGHSLGSVVSYDILCHQINQRSSPPMNQMSEKHEITQDSDKQTVNEKHLESTKQPLENSTMVVTECQDIEDMKESQHNESYGHLSLLDNVLNCSQKHLSPELPPKMAELPGSKEETTPLESEKIQGNGNAKGADAMKDRSTAECTGQTDTPKVKTRISSRKRYTPFIDYVKLPFEVDTFFAVGSPLGVFLSLRNIRFGNGGGKDYWEDDSIDEEMPACQRLLNIFHPFDPVAYRLEPLACKDYLEKQPQFVPYHRGGKRIHIGMQEFGKDLSTRSKAFVECLTTIGDQVANILLAKSAEKDDSENTPKPPERTYGALIMERLTGDPDGRIDHVLQDSTFEHSYLQAISSHTAYWRDPDTALFIIKQLYRDIPEEDPNPQPEDNLEREQTPLSNEEVLLLNEDYIADEEVALTFAIQQDLISSDALHT